VSDLSNPAAADAAGDAIARRIEQAQRNAEIIQRVNPDVLLLNEFDYVSADNGQQAIDLFHSNFLATAQNNIPATTGANAINFPYRFTAPSNTGIASGFDLDNNGAVVTTPGAAGYGNDAFGFGNYEGQYGMAFVSKYPIHSVRTFQTFRWKDMPGNLLTEDPTPLGSGNNLSEYYSAEEREVLRLSSKSHWDVDPRYQRHARSRAGVSSDASGLRRARRSQRQAQLRRDPLLERLCKWRHVYL
jgi:hypothetical protein